MINKLTVTEIVEKAIAGTDNFLVDVTVTPQNSITVEIDNDAGVDIDTCAAITRDIEAAIDRNIEDYDLEVGSAGLTSPFKVRRQYLKNIGREVEVFASGNRRLRGILTEAGDDSFTIRVPEKVKLEGKKRPEIVETPVTIPYSEASRVSCVLNFK